MPKPTTPSHSLVVKRSSAGLGLFAASPIPKGTFVIEYIGEVITAAEADRRGNRYLFEINSKWTIDGSARTNTARYINHACKPNCEARLVGKRVKIFTKRAIEPGEELCYDYGKEYFDEYLKPTGCRCTHCSAVKN